MKHFEKEATMGSRRSGVEFAFGNFDIEGGFAVSHQYDRTPAIVRPGDPVTVRATTVPEYSEVNAFVLDGSGPYLPSEIRDHGFEVPFYRSGDAWIATLPGRPDRTTVNYILEAIHHSGDRHHGDGRLPLDKARIFTHRVTTRRPPEWTKKAVIYQIFVDRFANADGELAMPEDDRAFAGGDLSGITAHLDWFDDLGVNCLWLTPVFECSSYHGYDTVDFKRVDDRFGGDEALRDLMEQAHARDIRVLLDLVPNHISVDHPWFKSALAGGPERDWFFIETNGSYQSFFSSKSMPKVNLDHSEARAAMIDVAAYWVREFGIDGYRIDHALGPTESFFAALTEEIEELDPDVWMFGEVTAMANLSRRYGGLLDGVTDFPFAYALRGLPAGKVSARHFAEIERESAAALRTDEFSWVRFFDNHDMSRAIHGWGDDPKALEQALQLLFSLPGNPSFFYGTEVALSHEVGEDVGGMEVGRVPMRFDRDHPMFDVTKRAIQAWKDSSNTQATPMYWSDDGASWTWGDLGGAIAPVNGRQISDTGS